ncbi:UDP-N-acetylmuramoyl-tripeptide--D-alanyl-D-alanine ligase [Campylobacter sp. MIT 12-8780]|uniref:Mur ligase family protein n=1 Tax=unclassified Campylobacter TaxID=2593542 RepID=UPI00115F349A|nr:MULTISPECIES: UDP-N-acetylmuramoyl-tripeptide--D-alanyl-D-alanine ligase [unclassified Campylobacter]NDJ27522.1 UDP-N-acetylmuramoyl-tripeptide--D-alanyl-D-alanine ligase [Campylobacter sp. MIT 19-121]TQR41278.1 UDP-N-acetylmuramoyl-tripeptide--D-alanyl-D-alanine ligase [Campylobacter sp. MIT 12-8780]
MIDLFLLNEAVSAFILNLCIGFYLILALQWYSYKLSRVFFHFARPFWHIYFIIVPWFVYILVPQFFIIFTLIYLLFFVFWYKKLDKKLVFTHKVKVFLSLLISFSLILSLSSYVFEFRANLLALVCALVALKCFDLYQKHKFIKQAQNKLAKLNKLTIILITASYGKTSMKKFLYELLKDDFLTHATPRSVNTLLGIVKDINENLNSNTQIYIAEAGARQKSDILELTQLLNPQICIVGEIGQAHLEYFKSKENIRATKLEALQSKRLQKAFLHSSTLMQESRTQIIYDTKLSSAKASLEGLEFSLKLDDTEQDFKANLLGEFNAQNLCACILVAKFLGLSLEKLKTKVQALQSVEHRLQIITKEPKFIIDDGFNGNFEGMKQSYELCKSYKGRKVLVTPGIIEVSKAQNEALASVINECFDFVIIIGESNAQLLNACIKIEKLVLKDKNELVQSLATHTKNGDLILFSNDTPSFM